MKKSLAIIVLTQLIILNIAALCSITAIKAQSQTTPEIYLDPASYTAHRIGETFNVTVNIRNLDFSQKLICAQFRIQYNATLLNATDATEGPFMQQFPNSAEAPYTFFINIIEADLHYGPNVLVGILLLPNASGQWTNYPFGTGTLATITFKTLCRPVEPSPAASCLLNLTDTLLVGDTLDPENVIEIPHTDTSATYYAQPIPVPRLSIQPADHQATLLGEMFTVNVNIDNLDVDWKLICAQFRIQYNATLLNATDATEGPFMQQFPNSAEAPYTFFINIIEADLHYGPNVLVGILLLPNASGQWMNYPYGNGTLATITFQIIGEPSTPHPTITSSLVLNDTLLVEDLNSTDVGEIPTNLINGAVQISPPTFTYAPVESSAGEVTIFTVTQPPNHNPLNYTWNFGDGTTMNTTSPTIGHAFPSTGQYNVTLTVAMGNASAKAIETVTIGYYLPLDVTAQVGSLHFKGETAEFTILTTDSGKPINPTNLEAKLYYNGALINDLSSTVQPVDTGFYSIPYYIPTDASQGEYTLLVKAEYYGVKGASMAKFTISPTLTAWNDQIAQITAIQNGVATISNGVTNLSLNLAAINATLTGLIVNNGQVLASISTTVGTLTTKLDTINAKFGDINGNTVTVSSMLGNITTKLDAVQSTATTTLYAASILSAIAVILAVAILIFMRKK